MKDLIRIIVGCLGSWDLLNESVLKQLGLTLEQIKKLAITMTIQAAKEPHTTYLIHISGGDPISLIEIANH